MSVPFQNSMMTFLAKHNGWEAFWDFFYNTGLPLSKLDDTLSELWAFPFTVLRLLRFWSFAGGWIWKSFFFFLKLPFIFERWFSQNLLGVNSSVSLVFTVLLAGNDSTFGKNTSHKMGNHSWLSQKLWHFENIQKYYDTLRKQQKLAKNWYY